MGRGARLPENTIYVDRGCEVAPACLACPLPRCKYDEPSVARVPHWVRRRQERIIALRDRGMTAREIARTVGVSLRTVYRTRKATYDASG